MKNRTAIVFGGTGLVGRALIDELVKSDDYDVIKIFIRSRISIQEASKIITFVVDFDNIDSFSKDITGDDLFICIGTTIKKAGSVKRMEEIDRDLPVKISAIASGNGVRNVAVVSSIGANAGSANYYLRIKGEMEKGISDQDFESVAILRPSLLLGEREEQRLGEKAGKIMMKFLGIFMTGKLRKYRGIEGRSVAKAMLHFVSKSKGPVVYESDILQKIADQ